MTKVHLLSIPLLIAGVSVAIAAPAVRQIHPTQSPVAVEKKHVDDKPLDPSLAQAAAFASEIESALATPGAYNLSSPGGVAVVRITHVGRERVIELAPAGSKEPRQWKLSSDATDAIVGATISEIMTATLQNVGPRLSGNGVREAYSEKQTD